MEVFVCRVVVHLDVRGVDKADAYETLHAWADSLRAGDGEGMKTLHEYQIIRARPSFDLKDIQDLRKLPSDPRGPEPVFVIDPTVKGTVLPKRLLAANGGVLAVDPGLSTRRADGCAPSR